MKRFWTWSGKTFGYRRESSLFTNSGVEVGRFDDVEIYGSDGQYLGEARNGNRLITQQSKKSKRKDAFSPGRGASVAPAMGLIAFAMPAGFENFPAPDSFG